MARKSDAQMFDEIQARMRLIEEGILPRHIVAHPSKAQRDAARLLRMMPPGKERQAQLAELAEVDARRMAGRQSAARYRELEKFKVAQGLMAPRKRKVRVIESEEDLY